MNAVLHEFCAEVHGKLHQESPNEVSMSSRFSVGNQLKKEDIPKCASPYAYLTTMYI
jgi:hypothetical protein